VASISNGGVRRSTVISRIGLVFVEPSTSFSAAKPADTLPSIVIALVIAAAIGAVFGVVLRDDPFATLQQGNTSIAVTALAQAFGAVFQILLTASVMAIAALAGRRIAELNKVLLLASYAYLPVLCGAAVATLVLALRLGTGNPGTAVDFIPSPGWLFADAHVRGVLFTLNVFALWADYCLYLAMRRGLGLERRAALTVTVLYVGALVAYGWLVHA
jgi:hypothetical protein